MQKTARDLRPRLVVAPRVRRSPAEWEEVVRAWRASGQTSAQFAMALGVRPTTLAWWSSELARRAREGVSTYASKTRDRCTTFVPVSLRAPAALETASPLLARVRVGHATVEVQHGADSAAIAALCRALREASC